MKLPRVSRKTWIALGLFVVLVAVLMLTTREGFQSKAQMDIFNQKLGSLKGSPHFQQLETMYPPPPNGPNIAPAIKFILPLQAVGYYGDVVGDDLQIKQSQLESMLNGTFPVDSVVTIENQKKIAQTLGENVDDQGAKMVVRFSKALYYVFAKGQVPPEATPEERARAQQQLNDPNDKINKPWTEQEKQWLRVAAGMIYKVVPDAPLAPGPSPSTPSSSANYSATCNKCTVMNNQITCACDVLPK